MKQSTNALKGPSGDNANTAKKIIVALLNKMNVRKCNFKCLLSFLVAFYISSL